MGVTQHPTTLRYLASISYKGKAKNLGYYSTVGEASYAYRKFKASYIEELTNDYKEYLPKHIYETLLDKASKY